MDMEIKAFAHEELSQALHDAGDWLKDNPEMHIDSVSADLDTLSGIWLLEIRYVDES